MHTLEDIRDLGDLASHISEIEPQDIAAWLVGNLPAWQGEFTVADAANLAVCLSPLYTIGHEEGMTVPVGLVGPHIRNLEQFVSQENENVLHPLLSVMTENILHSLRHEPPVPIVIAYSE